ncbi:MAG: MFS transporter [Pseudomonadota bacterium]
MKHALAPVAALLISVSILLTGQGLQGTLLPVRAGLENFPTVLIGAMGALYFLGFTVGCLKGGELVRRVGHVRVFLAMTALASATPLVHGVIIEPILWGILRFVTGFCFSVLYVVIESWLNERSSNENRGIVFSTYAMITLTVMAVGQMMTLLYDPSEIELFIIASILVSIGALPVALSSGETPEQPEHTAVDLRRLFAISPTGVTSCLAAGLANGAFWSLAPIFTASVSSGTQLAAWFMTAAVFGGAAFQWPLGLLSDYVSRRAVLIVVAIAGCFAGLALTVFAGQLTLVTASALGFIWGGLAFTLYTIAVAYANDYADASEFVMVSAGLLLMYGIGSTIGPFMASAVMAVLGAGTLFLFGAIAHALLACYATIRVFRRGDYELDEPITFSDALTATATASLVYEEEGYTETDEEDEE